MYENYPLKECWSPSILYQMGAEACYRGDPITSCPVDDTWTWPDRARICFERGWNTTREAIMNPIPDDDQEFIAALKKQGHTDEQSFSIIRKLNKTAVHAWQMNAHRFIRNAVIGGGTAIRISDTGALEIIPLEKSDGKRNRSNV